MKSDIVTRVLLVAVLLLYNQLPSIAQEVQYPTGILYPAYYDTSPPLSEMIASAAPEKPPTGPPFEVPEHEIPVKPSPFTGTDPVLQDYFGSGSSLALDVNFEGINNVSNMIPPDPNGAAGLDRYFQVVNSSFAVWGKDGTPVQAPTPLHVLWSGFPGPWQGAQLWDPIVLYDQYAERWVVVVYPIEATAFHLLFAVSATADPLGAYHRYAFQFSAEPDYPKIAVWCDAYYLSVASFSFQNPIGPGAAAIERDRMLNGEVARIVFFQRTLAEPLLLPSDVDGQLPPQGSPNYFAGIDIPNKLIRIYQLSVDWAIPAGSTFSNSVNLETAPFDPLISDPSEGVPQPGGFRLNGIGDRLMFRLQYRNFGTYETMVANHTVSIGVMTNPPHAGIRWYEMRKTIGTWGIHQQGTYAPDEHSRWMGSVAMDKHGSIGLGYSVSSGTVFPSIRVTGRLVTDPPGVMTKPEQTIIAGTGSQTTQADWGDYSSLHLDPTDDLTFWYANEYIQTTGSEIWQTRIGSFSIPLPPTTATIDQKDENDNRLSGTTVGRWNGSSFTDLPITNSPATISTFIGLTEVLRGSQQLMANGKYRVWRQGGQELVDNVQNHRGLLINEESTELTSKFHPTYYSNITIRNILDDENVNVGSIEFKDPWLIDTEDQYGPRNRGSEAVFHQVPSPFHPIGSPGGSWWEYQGAFLGQITVGGNPHYRVRALEIPYPGLTWYFQGWTATGATLSLPSSYETAVRFDQQQATLSAKYKAHLGSSIATATGSNSQRVFAGTQDKHHLIYSSAGELWKSTSYDAGATWDWDQRIGFNAGTASAPSLAFSSVGPPSSHEVYVVYRRQFDLNNQQIMFAIASHVSPSLVPISSPAIPIGIDTRPVIARIDDALLQNLHVLWQGSGGIWYNHAWRDGSIWRWDGERLYESLTGKFRSPSVSAPDLSVTEPKLYVTYDNGNDVFIFDEPNSGELNCAVPASVDPTSYSSQVCADNRNEEPQVHVVWEAYGDYGPPPPSTDGGTLWQGDGSGERRRVMYQQWSGTRWEDAHEFSSSASYLRPTVSNLSNGNIAWAWDDGTNTYKALSINNGTTWSVTEYLSNTTQPNLAISASEGPIASTRFVSTSASGAPYRLNFGAETTDGPQTLTIAEQYSRKAVVARRPSHRVRGLRHSGGSDSQNDPDSSSYLSVELSPISLKMRDGSTVPVEFAAVDDSVRDERSIWQSLVSLPVTLTSDVDSIIINGETSALSPRALAGVEIGVSFDLVDADRGTVLKRIGTERIFNGNGRGPLVRREKLAGVAGSRVFIRPSVRGFVGRSTNLVSTIVHVHMLLMDSTSNPTSPLAKARETPAALPTTFALHQNYPNPFNPTTEIRFDLPDVGNVSLVVYDVLGRKVAQLVSGYRDAGYHSASWNASGEASGVYFARFSVINAEGRIAYSKVNKLVLTK